MYDEDVIDRFGFEPPGSAHRPTLDIHLLKRLIDRGRAASSRCRRQTRYAIVIKGEQVFKTKPLKDWDFVRFTAVSVRSYFIIGHAWSRR